MLDTTSGPMRVTAGIGFECGIEATSNDRRAISCRPRRRAAASHASNSGRRPAVIGNVPSVLSPPATRSIAHASSSSCLTASAATSSTSAAGTTTTPSSSPTTTSPGITVTPAQAIGMSWSTGMCSRRYVAAC